MDYVTNRDNVPYYRWRDGQIKARENNVKIGFGVSGNVVKNVLIINDSMPGAEEPPPYAIYLVDLDPVTPPTDGGGNSGAYAILYEVDGTQRRFDEVV